MDNHEIAAIPRAGRISDAVRAGAFVLVGGEGIPQVFRDSPLTRLNYFDGKFLKAEDLKLEQAYHRRLLHESNTAGGAGVAYGYDVSLRDGDRLQIGPGLALDPTGRVLLLTNQVTVGLADLIEASRRAVRARQLPASVKGTVRFKECVDVLEPLASTLPTAGRELYIVSLVHAESLCGEEDVYGRICEDACISGTARPYWKEGIAVRVRPLELTHPLITSSTLSFDDRIHLRSLVASAYFAAEAQRVPSQVPSMLSGGWCMGSDLVTEVDVPIAVFARAGSSTLFLDPWIARRERMEAPARRYWAWRMGMRPWDAFLAQLLQFQCQLMTVLSQGTTASVDDPCGEERDTLSAAESSLQQLKEKLEKTPLTDPTLFAKLAAAVPGTEPGVPAYLADLFDFQEQFRKILDRRHRKRTSRVLLGGGIVELPPAGFLPVDPASTRSVNAQVERLLGAGLDLRFCSVRPDYVQHALEESQHMERISLVQGLDDPTRRPKVDILVPDGVFRGRADRLIGFEVELGYDYEPEEETAPVPPPPAPPPAAPETAPAPAPGFVIVRETASADSAETGGTGDTSDAGGDPETGDSDDDEGGLLGSLLGLLGSIGEIGAVRATLLGMGRGERLPEGGGGFYFAGMSGGMVSRAAGFMGRAVGTVAAKNYADLRKKPAEREALSSFIRATERTVREELRAERAATAGERTASATPPRQLARFDSEYARTYAEPAVVVWSGMSARRNPRKLRAGQATKVSFRLLVGREAGSSAERGVVVDLRLRGRFIVDTPARADGDATVVSGRLDGRATVEITIGLPSEITLSFSISHTLPLDLEWRDPFLAPRSLTLRMNGDDDESRFLQVVQTGGAGDVEVRFGAVKDGETASIPIARVNREDAVFQPAHERNRVAQQVIREIGGLLPRKGFAEKARKRLFSSSIVPTREIFSPKNWVLFRRRRVIDYGRQRVPCPPVYEPPVEVKYRSYRVFLVRIVETEVTVASRLSELADAVRAGGDVSSFEPRPIGSARFAVGGTALVGDTQALRAAWAAAEKGPRAIFGFMGSSRAVAATDDLAERVAQLRSTGDALDFRPRGMRAFDRIPSNFSPADVGDGVILLVTDLPEAPPQTQKMELYEVRGDRLIATQKQLESSGPTQAILGAMHRLGEVDFAATPPDFGPVVEEWARHRRAQAPTEAIIVVRSGESSPVEDQARESEVRGVGAAIATKLLPPGTSHAMSDPLMARVADAAIPAHLRAIAVLTAVDPSHAFYAIGDADVASITDVLTSKGPVPSELSGVDALGSIDFEAATGVHTKVDKVAEGWLVRHPGGVPAMAIVCAPPADRSAAEAEALRVAQRIGDAGGFPTQPASPQLQFVPFPASFASGGMSAATIFVPAAATRHEVFHTTVQAATVTRELQSGKPFAEVATNLKFRRLGAVTVDMAVAPEAMDGIVPAAQEYARAADPTFPTSVVVMAEDVDRAEKQLEGARIAIGIAIVHTGQRPTINAGFVVGTASTGSDAVTILCPPGGD